MKEELEKLVKSWKSYADDFDAEADACKSHEAKTKAHYKGRSVQIKECIEELEQIIKKQ